VKGISSYCSSETGSVFWPGRNINLPALIIYGRWGKRLALNTGSLFSCLRIDVDPGLRDFVSGFVACILRFVAHRLSPPLSVFPFHPNNMPMRYALCSLPFLNFLNQGGNYGSAKHT